MNVPFSLVIPCRNDGRHIARSIQAAARARETDVPLEFVVVDDASERGSWDRLRRDVCALKERDIHIRVIRMPERIGVPAARNLGAAKAQGDVLFFTDAHVRLSRGWDARIAKQLAPGRILAATLRDHTSAFRGFGCSLLVPFMGTRWNRIPPSRPCPVQIPSAAGTIMHAELFRSLGGYDDGFMVYGGAEPEFGVRAWLYGAEVLSLPSVEIFHRFKPPSERRAFLDSHRVYLVRNNLRFAFLYLDTDLALQALRLFAIQFPNHIAEALALLDLAEVRRRRVVLQQGLARDFAWFADRFGLRDQIGRPLSPPAEAAA